MSKHDKNSDSSYGPARYEEAKERELRKRIRKEVKRRIRQELEDEGVAREEEGVMEEVEREMGVIWPNKSFIIPDDDDEEEEDDEFEGYNEGLII